MKSVTSPWLKHLGESKDGVWFVSKGGQCRAFVCHDKLRKLFKIKATDKIRIVLTEDKPKRGHSVEVCLDNRRIFVDGCKYYTLLTALENFLFSGFAEFDSRTMYAYVEVKRVL